MKARPFLRVLLPLAVLAAGLLGARWLISHSPHVQRRATEPVPPLVETVPAEPSTQTVRIAGMGTVIAAQKIDLQPEVSGRIIWQSPKLQPGGLFRAGERILQIDPRDYEFAVKQKEAAVEEARLQVSLEKGREVIAKREWKLLEGDIALDQASRDLALRRPQQKNARAALEAAESALEQARLQVERTTVYAPFHALVQEEFVDEGKLVNPQTRLATLVGTDRFWVKASVPVDRLQWIRRPGSEEIEKSKVTIINEPSDNARIERPGRLVRVLGDLDPVGRMARVLIEIDDPLCLKKKRGPECIPLMLGAYVRVEIQGRRLEGIFTVPRRAVREGDRVWLLDNKDRLVIRPVKILWKGEKSVLVRNGLKDGDRIITNPIPSAVPGMRLRAGPP